MTYNSDRCSKGGSTFARIGRALGFWLLLAPVPQFAQSSIEERKIYVLGANDSLTELTLQTGVVKSNTSKAVRIVGVGKNKTFTEIAGVSAAVRVPAGTPQVFVLGTAKLAALPESLDPANIYATVVRFETNRKAGTRELLAFSYSGGYGFGRAHGPTSQSVIPLNFSRFGDHAIKIQPRSPLLPGEYGFLAQVAADPYATQYQVLYYCFGID